MEVQLHVFLASALCGDELQASAALPPKKEPRWVRELVRTLWSRDEVLVPAGN